MAARVNVYGGGEGFDVNCLFDAPFDPIVFRTKNSNIIFAEVMVIITCVLQHGRLVVAHSIRGGGGVLLEAGGGGPLCLTNISAWAGC